MVGMYVLLCAAESWCSPQSEETREFGAAPEWLPPPQVSKSAHG